MSTHSGVGRPLAHHTAVHYDAGSLASSTLTANAAPDASELVSESFMLASPDWRLWEWMSTTGAPRCAVGPTPTSPRLVNPVASRSVNASVGTGVVAESGVVLLSHTEHVSKYDFLSGTKIPALRSLVTTGARMTRGGVAGVASPSSDL